MSQRPDKWGKRSIDGYPIPKRCPKCRSRKTVLTTYKDDSKAVECNGCYSVIAEVA